MKVAHESDPSGLPSTPDRGGHPAGIRQGLRSIRPQGSHPRLLLEEERASGKSHEPNGCQQTLSNHPTLGAKGSGAAAESKEEGENNFIGVPGYLPHHDSPREGCEQLWGPQEADQPGSALVELPSQWEKGKQKRSTASCPGPSWGHRPWNPLPGKRTPSACPTPLRAPDPTSCCSSSPESTPRGAALTRAWPGSGAGVMGAAWEW